MEGEGLEEGWSRGGGSRKEERGGGEKKGRGRKSFFLPSFRESRRGRRMNYGRSGRKEKGGKEINGFYRCSFSLRGKGGEGGGFPTTIAGGRGMEEGRGG